MFKKQGKQTISIIDICIDSFQIDLSVAALYFIAVFGL